MKSETISNGLQLKSNYKLLEMIHVNIFSKSSRKCELAAHYPSRLMLLFLMIFLKNLLLLWLRIAGGWFQEKEIKNNAKRITLHSDIHHPRFSLVFAFYFSMWIYCANISLSARENYAALSAIIAINHLRCPRRKLPIHHPGHSSRCTDLLTT